MESWKLILFGIIALIVLAVAAEAYIRKNRSRPLSRVKNDAKSGFDHYVEKQQSQLGMEATNVGLVERMHSENERIEDGNSKEIDRHRYGSKKRF